MLFKQNSFNKRKDLQKNAFIKAASFLEFFDNEGKANYDSADSESSASESDYWTDWQNLDRLWWQPPFIPERTVQLSSCQAWRPREGSMCWVPMNLNIYTPFNCVMSSLWLLCLFLFDMFFFFSVRNVYSLYNRTNCLSEKIYFRNPTTEIQQTRKT